MDSKELHRAMKLRLPVVCDGVKYDRIGELVSWYDNAGKNHLSCGLIGNNHIVRVLADKVELAEVSDDG